jgi:hypothetical protein
MLSKITSTAMKGTTLADPLSIPSLRDDLEPVAVAHTRSGLAILDDPAIVQASIAISLKRIADALQPVVMSANDPLGTGAP